MLMNLAELAAYVRDVKPESDVHSNLPNHRSPLEKKRFQCCSFYNCCDSIPSNAFAAYAEPTPDNQYTTFVQK